VLACNVVARDGVVLATEKKQKSILYDDQTIHKVEQITQNVGMVYSGMGPDYRYWTFHFVTLCDEFGQSTFEYVVSM